MRNLFIFIFILNFFGCGILRHQEEIKPSGANVFDVPGLIPESHPGIENESKAIQKFLVGKLSSNENDKRKALKNLSDSSNLLESPPTVITKNIAELLLQEGKPQEALNKVEEALQKNPNDKELILYKIGILEVLNKFEEALEVVKKATQLFPDDEKICLLGATLFLKVNQADEAITLLSKAPPEAFEAKVLLAKVLYVTEKLDESADTYEALIAKKPSQSTLLVDLARVRVKQGKIVDAKKLLKKALLINKKDITARKMLASISSSEGKGKEAKHFLRDALKINENETDARMSLALLEIKDARYNEALNELNLLLIASPQDDLALFTRATTLTSLGRKDEALLDAKKIQETSSFFEKSQILIFLLSKEKGDYVGAYEAMKKAFELSKEKKSLLASYLQILEILNKPEEAIALVASVRDAKNFDPEIEFLYGVVLDQAEKRDEAFDVIQEVVRRDPHHALSLNYLAFVLAEEGESLSDAEGYCARALEIEPQNPYFLDTFGWIRFKQGRVADGLSIIDRALSVAPTDPDILEHKAIILFSTGDKNGAKTFFEKAIQNIEHNEEKRKMLTEKIESLSK